MDFLSGRILSKDRPIDGYIGMEDGRICEISGVRCPGKPDAVGLIMPLMVDAHTHCADGGVKARPGMSLEELVAPPDGLKHVYLRNTADNVLSDSMTSFSDKAHRNGIDRFIDFREGGVAGCRLLRNAVPGAVILGRPISPEYDANEIDDILNVADGIGVSSISDMDIGYIERIADHVRSKRKIFAIHASERVHEDIDTILSMDPTFVVHMVEATDVDLTKCAEAEVRIVVCARSNMYFGKVPPIKRMLDCGTDVALGTDNAMLCEPDMRAEASVFSRILAAQGGDVSYTWTDAFLNGRKILYRESEIELKVGTTADLAVMPCSGKIDPENALMNQGRIVVYKAGKRNELSEDTYTDRWQRIHKSSC
jgi:cytosine/adenosine deaminase-related metal-dependent hydrolase